MFSDRKWVWSMKMSLLYMYTCVWCNVIKADFDPFGACHWRNVCFQIRRFLQNIRSSLELLMYKDA
jgi:hypothetical protein